MRYMADQARGIAFPLFERVSAERAAQGWSWTQLKDRAGVARSTIYKWATNQTPPQPATVNAVADVLGIARIEALKLAGILKDPELDAECEYERRISRSDVISDDQKRLMILAHRDEGHSPWCRPGVEESGPVAAAQLRA